MGNYLQRGQTRKFEHFRQQQIIAITICLLICNPSLTTFLNVYFNLISSHFIWDTLAIYGLIATFFFISTILVIENMDIDLLILWFLFSIVYLLSFILYIDNRYFMFSSLLDFNNNNFYGLFLYAMPLYFFLRKITDYELLFKYFTITSKVIVISGLLTYILRLILKSSYEGEYMVFAYNILFGTIFCFYDYFQNRKVFSLLLAISASIVILVGGARGPVVCIGAYLLLYIIFNGIKNKARILSIAAILTVIIVYVSSNLITLAVKLNVFLIGLGIHSRTIGKILKDDLLDSSGRDSITEVLITYIKANPFFGHGMFGDRVITLQSLGRGSYAHNFIIEVLTQYGVIFGFIALGTFFLIIFGALFRRQDLLYKNLVLLFIPPGLIKLMVSGSYLQEMYFFLLLAAAVNAIKHKQESESKIGMV